MSNDRLKFRAWDDENLCWVRPKMVENESGVTVDERGFDLVMWTGLYDSGGDEIYEGDHVQWGEDVFETVFFDDGMFQTETSCMDRNGARNMTVVGNIYGA